MKVIIKKTIHYFQLYKLFITTSTATALSFRTSFVLLVLMDSFFYASTLLSVSFIYDHVSLIGTWNREQLLFFMSFMLGVDQLHMMVLSENFWELSLLIRTGQLDFILLRPTHSIFTTFFRYFRSSSILNGFIVWGCLIYYGLQVNLTWVDWLLLPCFQLLAFLLLGILELIISTCMFWVTEGIGINFLRMQFQQLSRWPHFIYSSFSRRIFTMVFPLLLIGSAPVEFLFDKGKWPLLVGMIIAIIVGLPILRFVWSMGLRRYNSASS